MVLEKNCDKELIFYCCLGNCLGMVVLLLVGEGFCMVNGGLFFCWSVLG